MSIFDQRTLKPCSDTFYFQLVPTSLHLIPNPSPITFQSQLLIFKLYKDQLLCDQSKKSINFPLINNICPINKIYLNFNLPVKQKLNTKQFIIKLYSLKIKQDQQHVQPLQLSPSNQQNKKISIFKKCQQSFYQIGSCILNTNLYMNQYQNNATQQFHQQCQLNPYFYFQFSLYLAKSRFSLQRYVKKTFQQKRTQSQKLSKVNQLSNQKQNTLSQITQNLIFINNDIKYQSPPKKPQNKQLILRNYNTVIKPSKFNLIEQQINIKDAKSLDLSDINIPIDINNMKQSFKKKPPTNPHPQLLSLSKPIPIPQHHLLSHSSQNYQITKFQLSSSLKTTQKSQQQPLPSPPPQPQHLHPSLPLQQSIEANQSSFQSDLTSNNQSKYFSSTKNTKLFYTQSQSINKSIKSKNLHTSQLQKIQSSIQLTKLQSNILRNNLFLAFFLISSVIVIINIMIPSRKV